MAKPKDQGLTPEEIRERIRASRSMQALQEAKRWAKEHPGPESEVLLAEAYAARIDAFARSGMQREVAELLKVARERLPAHAAQWQSRAAASVWRTGDLEPVLREWARQDLPEPRRKELSEQIERELRDPAHLLHDALPATDPLRLAAEAVVLALEEAADGALSPRAKEALQCVGRRSPLAPWRTFALALAAFHAGEDAGCRTLLANIPPGSALGKLAGVLLAELDQAPCPHAGPLETALVARLHGKASTLLRATADLDSAIAGSGKSQVQRALTALLDLLLPAEPRLAERIVLWVLTEHRAHEWVDPGAMLSTFLSRLSQDEAARFEAVVTAGLHPLHQWVRFAMWLRPRQDAPMRPLAPLALAQAIDFLLEHLEAIWEEAQDRFGLGSVARRRNALTPGGALLVVEFGSALVPADVDDYLCIQAYILADLRERHDGVIKPEPLGDPVAEFMLHRACIDLQTERMLEFVNRLERTGRRDGLRRLLTLWTKRAPKSAQAWLALARLEHGRGLLGNVQKAQKAIEKAAALDSVHAEIRALQFAIALGVLRRDQLTGQHKLVQKGLAHIRALPAAATRERRLYLTALALVTSKAAGNEVLAEKVRSEWSITGEPDPAHLEALALASTESPAWEIKVFAKPIGTSTREKWESLARLVQLAEAVDRGLLARVDSSELNYAPRQEDMPADHSQLLAICRYARAFIHHDVEYVASGVGMAKDSPELERFLVHRAGSLLPVDRERTRELVRLALESAQQRRDQTLVQYITSVAPSLPGREAAGRHTQDLPSDLLARERAAPKTLDERRARPARPTSVRPRVVPRPPKSKRRTSTLPFETQSPEAEA